jgi:hypothetical protein
MQSQAFAKSSCSSAVLADLGAVWDLVGQTYNGPANSSTFTYQVGASSRLGTAVSSSGKYGTWSASGTKTKSSTSTQSYPTYGHNKNVYYDSQFHYKEFVYTCVDPITPVIWSYFTVEPVSYAGGSRTRLPASPPAANYCVPEQAGATFRKTSTQAVTWTNGVDISWFIGFGLQSTTGYSATASVYYSFHGRGRLCGTGAYPAETPYQLAGKGP